MGFLDKFRHHDVPGMVHKVEKQAVTFQPDGCDHKLNLVYESPVDDDGNVTSRLTPGQKDKGLVIVSAAQFGVGKEGVKKVDIGFFGSAPKALHGQILELFTHEGEVVTIAVDAGFPVLVNIETAPGAWEFKVGEWVDVTCEKGAGFND
ncbi:MAG: hypothetical protein ACREJ2_12450 [Planctomycetota bacterium]